MAAQLKFVAPGIQVRIGEKGNTIRYFATVAGERKTKSSDIDYALAVNPKNHRPTAILLTDYQMWVDKLNNEHGSTTALGLRVPTLRELIELYEDVAMKRAINPNIGRPGERAIGTAIKNYRFCVDEAGLEWERPCTDILDQRTIRFVLNSFMKRMKPISAWSYVQSIQSVTTKWATEEYEMRGFKVPQADMPARPVNVKAPQYQKLPEELRKKIENWYCDLAGNSDRYMYLAATMMAQLAMRDCDVPLLTAENFIDAPDDPNGLKHIRYQPRKTKHSSGRWVEWPIMASHWDLIREIAGERLDAGLTLLPCRDHVFRKLNESMRKACGMENSQKGVYELRKMCIDNVRRVMGPDAAVQISGDRRETVDHYYADPYKPVGITPVATMPLTRLSEQSA